MKTLLNIIVALWVTSSALVTSWMVTGFIIWISEGCQAFEYGKVCLRGSTFVYSLPFGMAFALWIMSAVIEGRRVKG